MQPIVIADGLNNFIRAYEAYPQHSMLHGAQIGGCVGFLKTIAKIAREVQPSRIYCAWESGGSARRRALYNEYKLYRRPARLNRFYEDDIPDTEENRKHQLATLLQMLKNVPVCQLLAQDAEADDLIAYLCRGPLRSQKKVIMSGDKDMWQLFDDDTWAYSPHRKRFVTKEDVFEELRITTRNIAVAKALAGDGGDNVPGVKGCGWKTIAKRFPMLGLDQDVLLQDVIDYAHSHRDEAKVYRNVIDCEGDLRRNYKLVFLDGSMIPANQQAIIDDRVAKYEPRSDRVALIKQLTQEGVGDFDVLSFFDSFDSVMTHR